MKTFDFTLSEPIDYQKGGENVKASLLELSAPAVNNRKRVAKMKQGFMRAINELPGSDKQKEKEHGDEKKKKEEPKPKEVLALLQMGSVDYADYIDIFINLLTSGVCKVEGEVALTQHIAEKISFEDLERLLGEYLVNFILASLGE